ncbi:MAG TPA: sulfite exporter TauE/SafE family protein [Methylomirabilota bacterium]|nr:sulfite exporter TauE/SafE family protein [Methylomirabilota bacterium]
MLLVLGSLAVLAAAFVKGSIGFGFPTLGTPLLSLVTGVQAAVVLLILPNIAMDGLQLARLGGPGAAARRFATLLAAGAVGTLLGTWLLIVLSPRTALLILGVVLLLYVAASAAGVAPRVRPEWERVVSPLVGFGAGVIGGVTNVPGTPLVMYFNALGLAKGEFLAAVAFTFIVYKLVQLGAVVYVGLLSWPLAAWSAALMLVALGGFWVGLRVQDRLDQRSFNRVVLGFLALLGLWLAVRGLRSG